MVLAEVTCHKKEKTPMSNEAIEFLKNNPIQYLATVDESGNPRVRPFMFMLEKNGKPYYSTSNQKSMYTQIKAHPRVEITTTSPELAWIRISADIEFVNDMTLKKEIIEAHEMVKGMYQTAENPEFEVFTISGTAVIADFSGQPPKTYTL
jgi:uncharacterized pyridoxamine 5'-phosphate oxidase family protein